MPNATCFDLQTIGTIQSTLQHCRDASRQSFKGDQEATIAIQPEFAAATAGIQIGMQLVLLTWLHQSQRDILQVRPGRDPDKAQRGVFATRSPVRPNPIGLHEVTVTQIPDDCHIGVQPLEAIDGTPVVDIKIALRPE